MAQWERVMHREGHLLQQCLAEALGAFFYCFCGIGSQAANVLGTLEKEQGIGSVIQIGWAYCFGVILALTVAGPTSGGHFNPGVTITHAVFGNFPYWKIPFYIVSQIIGAFVACLTVYLVYRDIIWELEATLAAAGTLASVNFTPQGPAGIFGLYVSPDANLGAVFWTEFSCDFILGLSIWAAIDPTNFYCPPAAAPFVMGIAYATCIWGFSPIGLAANSARDIGARIMVLCIWGKDAAGGPYAAIAALTNIPATLLSAFLYDFFIKDTDRVVPQGTVEYLRALQAHEQRLAEQPSVFASPADIEKSVPTDQARTHSERVQ